MSSPVGAEGRIDIRLDWQAAIPSRPRVRLHSSRPVLACRVFEQRGIEQALTLVPMLFSVCGRAQSVAAVRAVESALVHPAATEVETQRDTLVALESIREHLWRVLIDWPQLMGATSRTDLLAPLNQGLNALMAALSPAQALSAAPGLQRPPASRREIQPQWRSLRTRIETCLFAGDAADWLGVANAAAPLAPLPNAQPGTPTPSALWDWLQQRDWLALGDAGLQPLPPLPADALVQRLSAADGEHWVAQPDWQGQPRESGPLARHADHPRIVACRQRWGDGLATRLTARLVALAELLREVDNTLAGSVSRRPLSGHRGLAQLETSRGRLIHHVEIAAGVISRYRILAPTEWNFHPQGIAAQMLGRLNNDQPVVILEQQARWLLQAIDPCVSIDLSIDLNADLDANLDADGGSQATSPGKHEQPTTRAATHA